MLQQVYGYTSWTPVLLFLFWGGGGGHRVGAGRGTTRK